MSAQHFSVAILCQEEPHCFRIECHFLQNDLGACLCKRVTRQLAHSSADHVYAIRTEEGWRVTGPTGSPRVHHGERKQA